MNFTLTDTMIRNAKSLDAALILAIMMRFEQQKGEWFVMRAVDLDTVAAVSSYRQRTILEQLESLGLIEVVVRGMPARRHVRINHEAISKE